MHNTGVYPFSGVPQPRGTPFMISGLGRSGTTALARCCSAVLRPWWPADSPNAEDTMTTHWHVQPDPATALELWHLRTGQAGPAWLTKVPGAVSRAVRDPQFHSLGARFCWAVIVRDPVAGAFAEVYHGRRPFAPAEVARRAGSCLATVRDAIVLADRHIPVCLVSCEKLFVSPRAVLSNLWTWLGIPWNSADMTQALAQIRPGDDPRYYHHG